MMKVKLLLFGFCPAVLFIAGYFFNTWTAESLCTAIFGVSVGFYIKALEVYYESINQGSKHTA